MALRNLLVNLGNAAVNAAAKFDPSGVASALLDQYAEQHKKAELRAELEELLRLGFAQFKEQVADALADHRLQVAEGVRLQVEAYLVQFQTAAKQAARHRGDPSATTVPAVVDLESAGELAAFLPPGVPRFKAGDAVPGLPSWRLVEPLGAGGFGEVWKAEHPFSGEPTAFKFFLDSSARKRFTSAEASALFEIHHKAPTSGVVRLLQAEPEQNPPWLQFEFVPGGDLSGLPAEWLGLSPAERVTRVREVIRTLAGTVGHFHALGVVHRDLKPSNVLRRADGSLVVADFGISRIVPSESGVGTPNGAALATIRAYTPAYASPQQKRFAKPDRRDDVYALGVLWYQLLQGDLALDRPAGESWKRMLRERGVSEPEIALLNRCWDDEPDERPADGKELLAELDVAFRPVPEVLTQQTLFAHPPEDPAAIAERERQRKERVDRERAERMKRLEASGELQKWLRGYPDGWSTDDFNALIKGLMRPPYWPLRSDEVAELLGRLQDEARAGKSQRAEEPSADVGLPHGTTSAVATGIIVFTTVALVATVLLGIVLLLRR